MAYHNIYHTVVSGLTDDLKLRVDSILGINGAVEEYAKHRASTAATAGFEVG